MVDVITAKDIPGKKVRTMCGYDEELLAEAEVERITNYPMDRCLDILL